MADTGDQRCAHASCSSLKAELDELREELVRLIKCVKSTAPRRSHQQRLCYGCRSPHHLRRNCPLLHRSPPVVRLMDLKVTPTSAFSLSLRPPVPRRRHRQSIPGSGRFHFHHVPVRHKPSRCLEQVSESPHPSRVILAQSVAPPPTLPSSDSISQDSIDKVPLDLENTSELLFPVLPSPKSTPQDFCDMPQEMSEPDPPGFVSAAPVSPQPDGTLYWFMRIVSNTLSPIRPSAVPVLTVAPSTEPVVTVQPSTHPVMTAPVPLHRSGRVSKAPDRFNN